MYQDKFGFLPLAHTVEWTDGCVAPLRDYSTAADWIKRSSQPDGYIYPPIVVRRRVYWSESGEEVDESVPGSEHPAQIYRLPASHSITLASEARLEDVVRKDSAGFVIHFLGLLFGRRCQFWDWWVDGRLSVRSWGDAAVLAGTEGVLVDEALNTWAAWSEGAQRVLLNALFMHNRASSYCWDWERFLIAYQVFDACCSVAHEVTGIAQFRQGAPQRWAAACNQFGLLHKRDLINDIRTARNSLVHETLWIGQQPTEFVRDGYYFPLYLASFNQRFFLALLGIDAEFLCTDWATLSQRPLIPN